MVGSVGAAKDHHVFGEVGQVLAQFLVLLVLAFIRFRPQLHPGVLPDDVADAGGRETGQEGEGKGGGGGGRRARAGAVRALTWVSLPTGQRRCPTRGSGPPPSV